MRRFRDSVFPPSFPPTVPCSDTRLPSTGSLGLVPRLPRYCAGAPTPPWPSRRASLPSHGRTVCARTASLPQAASCDNLGPGGLITRSSTPGLRRSQRGLPGSWRTHTQACPALRPRRDLRTRPVWCVGAAFRWLNGVGSRDHKFRGSITRPTRSLCTLRSTGHPVPRNTRFRPLAKPCRVGMATHRVPMKGFRPGVFLLSQALPGALNHFARENREAESSEA